MFCHQITKAQNPTKFLQVFVAAFLSPTPRSVSSKNFISELSMPIPYKENSEKALKGRNHQALGAARG
jgi:hypothetical protein